jgi:hypothetical protein
LLVSCGRIPWPWRRRRYFPPKLEWTFIRLHGVTSQKSEFFKERYWSWSQVYGSSNATLVTSCRKSVLKQISALLSATSVLTVSADELLSVCMAIRARTVIFTPICLRTCNPNHCDHVLFNSWGRFIVGEERRGIDLSADCQAWPPRLSDKTKVKVKTSEWLEVAAWDGGLEFDYTSSNFGFYKRR